MVTRRFYWEISGLALAFIAFVVLAADIFAAEVIPPKPQRYFNDYANGVSLPVQQELDRKLEALEKSDGSQIVVAIYPKMQSDSSIEDYANRVFKAWGVGQKTTNNGAVLFVFPQDRRLRIEVGYGLEGAIPDATANDIIRNRITPALRSNDYDGALRMGVDSLIQAAKGEYKGSGRTVAQNQRGKKKNITGLIWLGLFLFLIVGSTRRKRGYLYGGRGRSGWGGPIWWGGGGWGGGTSSGGGSGGGWSGGFSGGGGISGGGGASGSW